MLLTELLTPDRIKIPLASDATRTSCCASSWSSLADTAVAREREDVLRAVREREEVLSTGIGNGVAIPHGKSAAVERLDARRRRGAARASTSRRSTASPSSSSSSWSAPRRPPGST